MTARPRRSPGDIQLGISRRVLGKRTIASSRRTHKSVVKTGGGRRPMAAASRVPGGRLVATVSGALEEKS